MRDFTVECKGLVKLSRSVKSLETKRIEIHCSGGFLQKQGYLVGSLIDTDSNMWIIHKPQQAKETRLHKLPWEP